jgi:hypothetical protein
VWFRASSIHLIASDTKEGVVMEGDHQLFQERTVTSWKEAKDLFEEIDQHFIFRGQRDASWLLRTSIERSSFFAKSYHVERDFVQDFQRGASTYSDMRHLPKPDDYLSWLSLMQHYGAPTRLLDFSLSPYVAVFFALEGAVQNSAVWAIEKDHLKEDLHHKFPFEYHEDIFFDLKEDVFNTIFTENKIKCVFPVRPVLADRRYLLQQAIFVSLGNSNETFMQQLEAYQWPQYLPEHILKIVIPSEIREEALWDLSRMNIHRATLFGDLEGYSAYLKSHYELRHNGAQITLQQNALERKQIAERARRPTARSRSDAP